MQLIQVIQDVFNAPPIPYEPQKHSLKAWAKYCLQDRGFKVIYAQNADFAIESRGREKLDFKVTDTPPNDLSDQCGWLILDPTTGKVKVVAPLS
jgi:hypothetical protein